jgi:hypothetical protein
MYDDSENQDVCLKIYESGRDVLIAVCDLEILGKTFKEGPLQVEISPEFYGTEAVSYEEVEAALASATIANFAGCRAVECAIRLGFVEQENVLSIDGVLCAQMVRM